MNPDFLDLAFSGEKNPRFEKILTTSIEDLEKLHREGAVLSEDEIALFRYDDFYFLYAVKNYPEMNFTDIEILPSDDKKVRYRKWRDVVISLEKTVGAKKRLLEKLYPRVGQEITLPKDIRILFLSNLNAEEIISFCESSPHRETLCSDPNSILWQNLWKREINDKIPKDDIRKKLDIFFIRFNRAKNYNLKFSIAAKLGAVKQKIFMDAFENAPSIQDKFRLAGIFGDLELTAKTLEEGASINYKNYQHFLDINKYGHLEIVRFLLALDPEAIKTQNFKAFEIAAQNGYLEIVKFFVSLDPNIFQKNGYLALIPIIINDHFEIVRFLLALNPEAIEAYNYAALRNVYSEEMGKFLFILAPEGARANNYESFRIAARNGYLELIRLYLEYLNSLPVPEGLKAIKSKNYDSIALAVFNRHREVVRLLVSLDPSGIEANDYKALKFAMDNKDLEMIRILLDSLQNLFKIPEEIKKRLERDFGIVL